MCLVLRRYTLPCWVEFESAMPSSISRRFKNDAFITFKDLEPAAAFRLRTLGTREDILCTKDLVQTYSLEEDPCVRKVYRLWLNNYVEWLSEAKDVPLDDQDMDSILDLCELKNDTGLSQTETADPKTHFILSICNRALRSKFGDPTFEQNVEILDHALNSVDAEFFETQTRVLDSIMECLLHHLKTCIQSFTRQIFPIAVKMLLASHSTIALLYRLEGRTREEFVYRLRNELSCATSQPAYFLFEFYRQIIEHSLNNLQVARRPICVFNIVRYLFYKSHGTLFHRRVPSFLNRMSLEKILTDSTSRTKEDLASQRPWTPHGTMGLINLFRSYKESIETENAQLFAAQFNNVWHNDRQYKNYND